MQKYLKKLTSWATVCLISIFTQRLNISNCEPMEWCDRLRWHYVELASVCLWVCERMYACGRACADVQAITHMNQYAQRGLQAICNTTKQLQRLQVNSTTKFNEQNDKAGAIKLRKVETLISIWTNVTKTFVSNKRSEMVSTTQQSVECIHFDQFQR